MANQNLIVDARSDFISHPGNEKEDQQGARRLNRKVEYARIFFKRDRDWHFSYVLDGKTVELLISPYHAMSLGESIAESAKAAFDPDPHSVC